MLNREFVDDVINRSLQRYGVRQCMNQTIEELAELTVEVAKDVRGFDNREKVIEEMADVLVCYEYLMRVLNIETCEIENVMRYKLERLSNRLKGDGGVYGNE